MENTTLLELIDLSVRATIASYRSADEQIPMRVATDLNPEGNFGRQWLAVTRRRALLVAHGGEPSPTDSAADQVVEIAVDRLRAVQTEPLVGGGRPEIERLNEPFLVSPKLERTRCRKCHRLLPEKDGICPACVSKWTIKKHIARYVHPHRWRAVLLVLAMVLVAVGEVVPPMVTKRIVEDVLVTGTAVSASTETRSTEFAAPAPEASTPGCLELLGLLVLASLVVRTFVWAMDWVHGWVITWLGPQVTADIRSHLYRRLEMLSLQFYDKCKVGALMSRATRDASMLEEFIVDGPPFVVTSGLMITGILGLMFWMSWSLSLYVILPLPLIIIWGILFWRRLRRMFMKWS